MLSSYRIMWLFVLFDLPTKTSYERKIYTQFRKKLLKDGFHMFQFSIYCRQCASRENRDVHLKRVKRILPKRGHVGIMTITDKQFGMIELYYGRARDEGGFTETGQLELF